MGKDETPALALVFDQKTTRVPGDAIIGEVHIYYPTLIADKVEEVHIKLRGVAVTKIQTQAGSTLVEYQQNFKLVRETSSLWQKGGAYPPAGEHTLVLPFHFELPTYLLPSCSFKGPDWSAKVKYSVQAVGKRSGLHFNRRVIMPFPVLPTDVQGAGLRSAVITKGWQGGWKVLEQKDKIRKGILGDYSHVTATLVIPDIEIFPMKTPIPFTLNIVTVTKSMKMDDVKEGEPLFPAPPLHPKEIEFGLNAAIVVRAREWTRKDNKSGLASLGGFGSSADPQYYDSVQIETSDRVWIPSQDSHDEKKRKGQWKQEVTFKSSFTLSQPPCFKIQILELHYTARLKMAFPGIGNNVKLEFPLPPIVSCMPPLGTQPWDGPPPEFDIPPSYFSAEEWHKDEKNDSDD